jgi:SEC-C motif domain protein
VKPCPCSSGKIFAVCCAPYLEGRSNPRTVKQLMRSRYSAFALGGHGDYLLQTWHPRTAPAVSAQDLGRADTLWTGLQIVDSQQRGNQGMVEFRASFLDADGKPDVHHEKSSFVREGGRWFYLSA